MAQDSKLRNYLVGTLVTVTLTAGGWAAATLYARVDAVEEQLQQEQTHSAVIEQDVKDFRRSFEEFKTDVKQDIERHNR